MTKNVALMIGGMIVIVVIAPLLLMFFWSWTIPDVLAGMVENHILPESITYIQAIKLFGLFATLGIGIGISGSLRSSK